MKILHIIDSLETGGAENLLIDFIKGYKIGFDQDSHYIVTLSDSNSLLKDVLPYISDFSCLKFHKLTFWEAAYILNRLLKKWKVDVIHSHLFYSTIIARLARCHNSKIRIVTTYHNMEYCSESPLYSWKFPFIDKLTLPRSNYHSIFVSNPVADCIIRQVPGMKNFSILANFTSNHFHPKYHYKNGGQLKLVTVGSLSAVKNHIYALRELALLNDKRVSLDIYGRGELYEDLIMYINKHSLPVQLKGNARITSELLADYDAFLMPSLSEGMPLALIEAIVTGLPSIITDLPQLRETAEDAAIYFKLEEGTLCTILKQLLDDKDTLKYMANKTDRLRQKFEIKDYVNVVRQIYIQNE